MRLLYGAIYPAEEADQGRTNRTVGKSTADGSLLTEGSRNHPGITARAPTKSFAEAQSGRAGNGDLNDEQRAKLTLSAAFVAETATGVTWCCRRPSYAIVYGNRSASSTDHTYRTEQYNGETGSPEPDSRSGCCSHSCDSSVLFIIHRVCFCGITRTGTDPSSTFNSDGKRCSGPCSHHHYSKYPGAT